MQVIATEADGMPQLQEEEQLESTFQQTALVAGGNDLGAGSIHTSTRCGPTLHLLWSLGLVHLTSTRGPHIAAFIHCQPSNVSTSSSIFCAVLGSCSLRCRSQCSAAEVELSRAQEMHVREEHCPDVILSLV